MVAKQRRVSLLGGLNHRPILGTKSNSAAIPRTRAQVLRQRHSAGRVANGVGRSSEDPMKRRAETLLLALALAAGAFWLQAIAVPTSTFACSCVPPADLEEVAADGDSIVIAIVEGKKTINVTHTFTGAAELGLMQIRGLGPHSDACQEGALEGETWLFSLSRHAGRWSTTICELNGLIGTDYGDSLLAEAIELFGPILPPTSAEDLGDTSTQIGGPGYGAALAIGAGVLIFVLIVARRRPSGT